LALALAGNTWAVSPYDTAYGVQWSFLIGHPNADSPNTLAVSPDGTVWITTAGTGNTGTAQMLTWGTSKTVYGSSGACGYGQISRLGGILQCNDIPNVTGISAYSQGASPTITFSASNPTAYFGVQPNSAMRWTDASPDDVAMGLAQPATFAISSVLDQTGFEPYGDYVNPAGGSTLDTTLPRKNDPLDATKKFTHNLVSLSAYGGAAMDFKVASDGSYYFARQNQGPGPTDPLSMGDAFTVGDFSGPAGQNYKPCVGRISADGLTRSGPAHQPSCGGRSFFTDVAINESANAGAGKVYACGYGFNSAGSNMTYLDPDGPGPIASIPFDSLSTNSNKGFAIVYNATTWAIDKVVTWESTYGGDFTTDITSRADGGFVLVGQTLGSLGGFTNPVEGTNDGYLEVYDASGTLAWKYQTETTVADTFGDVSVDADGYIYVSGNSGTDTVLWKFTSAGTLVWTTIIDNGGTVESQRDHGGDKKGFFYLSSHNKTSSGAAAWPNTIAYAPQGTDDALLQRLSPGDFNADKFVNFADVQIAGTATKPGLTGVDTYDFNGDGDSTLADTTYMITEIMDRPVGDIAQDKLAADVDNADIGRAIGASGVGTLYLDGDLDWDADVDTTDIAAMAAAFTGAKKPGAWTNGTPDATLRYQASNGQVWLKADEATGGIITSFQLENAAGTFVPANFTGPTGGSFGGSLKEATTSVLADTDLTLAGSAGTGGLISLGAVLPPGMDLAGLTAYLKTAVYTGQLGSGQMQFTLEVLVDSTPPTLVGIVDNKSGGPAQKNNMVTYTVTFSEDMDASSVDASDFEVVGSAPSTIGTVIETAPGVFSVQVTPTDTGTMQLQVKAFADIRDLAGLALDTNTAIADDTILTVNPDTTAPAPDPMTWVIEPRAINSTSITMTATTASDGSGVEYFFECTAGGGNSSGWQFSPTYTDTGLSVETSYSYRVQARDLSPAQNATGFSATASATTAGIATMSYNVTAPAVDGQDIANFGDESYTDKWFTGEGAKGQTFTTGATPALLKSVTYRALGTTPDKTYTIRVGTVSGTTFSLIRSYVATQSDPWYDGEFVTWTFATPVPLDPNTVYGLDIVMTSSTSPYQEGIPYLNLTGNTYAGGVRYQTDEYGTSLNLTAGNDRVFHLDIGNPTAGYADWSGGLAADIDSNGDGVDNGVAWALGAADPNANAIGLLPAIDNTTDPTYLLFNFNRSDEANDDPNTTITVEYGNDLVGWTTAVDDNDNVEIEVTPGTPTDAVVVKLKRSTLGATGKIFARLKVVVTP
jgi:hypothetical protein